LADKEVRMNQSFKEGDNAEEQFIQLRGDNFIRKADREENIHEHWDVLDKELGRVDVKAAKRKFRNGPVDFTIWWELRTVKRPPENKPAKGWGVPNGINRFIAVRSEDKFILIDPSNIYEDLQKRCVEYYRGEFGLHTRPGRGDLMTILPLEYVIENATMELEI
jgi:hypothetical protein